MSNYKTAIGTPNVDVNVVVDVNGSAVAVLNSMNFSTSKIAFNQTSTAQPFTSTSTSTSTFLAALSLYLMPHASCLTPQGRPNA